MSRDRLYCEHCGSGPECGVCGRNETRVFTHARVPLPPSRQNTFVRLFAVAPGLYIRHVLNCTVVTYWPTCNEKYQLIVRGRFTTPHAILTQSTRKGGDCRARKCKV